MAVELFRRRYDDGSLTRVVISTRADGDLARSQPPDLLAKRRAALAEGSWSWLEQVHGAEVHVVGQAPVEGLVGDALVSEVSGMVLSVQVADCAPVAFLAGSVVGVAHAGWRGVLAGVLDRSVSTIRSLRPVEPITAVVGPCISAACYEFGDNDLSRLESQLGASVRAVTSDGRPALDLREAVRLQLAACNVEDIEISPLCTATRDDQFWSHRARAELGRQSLVIWRQG